MDDRQYLIAQAVNQYNTQFAKSLAYDYFDVRSIPTRVNFDRSYEVYSVRFDDYLRLHIHLTFSDSDRLGPYRVETDQTHAVAALGDEVFVSVGSINRFYVDSGYYKFNTIQADETSLPVLLMESGMALLDESGDYILLETGAQLQ